MEKLYKNMAKCLSWAWLRNLLDEATKSSDLIGEGGGGVVKVENRKWEVRSRSSIFALQKSTFDFDFSICELTFYFVNSHLIFDFDFSLWRSTFGFDFLLSMATLGHGTHTHTQNWLNSVFYSIKEIETKKSKSYNCAKLRELFFDRQDKTRLYTCRKSCHLVGELVKNPCIFTTLISQQKRNTRRNSINIWFQLHIRLSTQLAAWGLLFWRLRELLMHCVTKCHSCKSYDICIRQICVYSG